MVEAGYDLTMAEHDLMTLAINKIHKQQTGAKQVMITAKEFAAANQVSDIYAYKTLKNLFTIKKYAKISDIID